MKIRVSRYVAEKIHRTRADFRLDFFRCGGHGGQNVNKVNTGVRITDKVTGIAVEGREERSQLQNREAAFRRLVDRLIAFYGQQEKELRQRSLATRTIRSYKDGIVLDHRTSKSYDLDRVLDGDLGPVIRDCREWESRQ